MSKTLKNTLAGFAVAALMLMGAGSAKAATIAELQALIADLTAQLSDLSGGSSSCGYMHSMTLRQGMSGSQVMALQTALGISADGKFGPMTATAVMNFQGSHGLTKDGVVGPMTGAKICAGNPNPGNPNPSNPGLEGDFGTISDVDELSTYNNEEVGEGEEDVAVLGMDVEADQDGDVMLRSVKVALDSTGNTGSDNLDDYIDSVSIWMGGEKIGEADVEDFNESGNVFSKTIAVDDAVIRADDTEEVLVAVTAANTFDSSDISGDSWTIDVDSIRFEDGSGVVTTDSTTGDIDGMDVTMDFVSFSSAADTELKISTASDSPEADVVLVDDSSSTDDVVLLKGKLKLEGDSDAVIDEMPISFSPVGANINVIAESLKLVIDGEEYSESVPSIADGATGSVTFDNLDFDLGHGDTVEFEVLADITDLDGTIFAEGDTLEANVTSDNRDLMDVENEEGDQLTDSSEKSGTANGEAQEFRTEGIMLSLVSTSSSAGSADSDQTGTFTIKFKVEAMGSAVYVSSLAATSLTTSGTGAVAGVERAGTATIGGTTVTIVNTTDTDLTSVGNYLIEDGEEETFEMVVTASLPTAGADGQFRALLRALDWDTDDDATPDQTYTSNLDSYKTSYISLQ